METFPPLFSAVGANLQIHKYLLLNSCSSGGNEVHYKQENVLRFFLLMLLQVQESLGIVFTAVPNLCMYLYILFHTRNTGLGTSVFCIDTYAKGNAC